jgi:hypothetical protein
LRKKVSLDKLKRKTLRKRRKIFKTSQLIAREPRSKMRWIDFPKIKMFKKLE